MNLLFLKNIYYENAEIEARISPWFSPLFFLPISDSPC